MTNNRIPRKKIILFSALALLLCLALWIFGSWGEAAGEDIVFRVRKGPFEIAIVTSGELEAKNSVEIKGPKGLRAAGIWNAQISSLVPEGTRVKKGDHVASIDKAEISTKLNDAFSELTRAQSVYTQTQLDTTLELSEAREKIVQLEFENTEKQITLEQSKFEPPATIRQAEIDLEKAERELSTARSNLTIKTAKARAKMQEASASLSIAQSKVTMYQDVLGQFTITAPEDGMVIYKRDWDGKKITTGSQISAWDPTVATLPDLSVMLSKTYVNEVDIRKVEAGQSVEITFDAFPEKFLTGKVIEVANVGEQKKGSDAKVFAVDIQVNESDSVIRPGMTTGNRIIVQRLDEVLFIPLDCVHSQGDTLAYVFIRKALGSIRKQIVLGQSNEDHVIVKMGLQENDVLYLSRPADGDNLKLEALQETPAGQP